MTTTDTFDVDRPDRDENPRPTTEPRTTEPRAAESRTVYTTPVDDGPSSPWPPRDPTRFLAMKILGPLFLVCAVGLVVTLGLMDLWWAAAFGVGVFVFGFPTWQMYVQRAHEREMREARRAALEHQRLRRSGRR